MFCVCGAVYIYGDVWKHEPTGEHIHIGQDCASKYEMLADRSAFELEADRRKAATARECQKVANRERRVAFLNANEGLEQALKTLNHPIVTDIANRFASYCELSDKQIALVMKLANEVRASKAREKLIAAPISAKRAMFRGVIVSAKSVDGYRGGTEYKITIKIETPDGNWLAWGTCPNSMIESAPIGERGRLDSLRGAEVEITAVLKAALAPHFAIMNRPTGKVVKWSAASAAKLNNSEAD